MESRTKQWMGASTLTMKKYSTKYKTTRIYKNKHKIVLTYILIPRSTGTAITQPKQILKIGITLPKYRANKSIYTIMVTI